MASPVDIPDWSGSGLNGTQLIPASSGYKLGAGGTQNLIVGTPNKQIVLYLMTLVLADNTTGQFFYQDDAGKTYFQYTSNGLAVITHPFGGQSLPVGSGLTLLHSGIPMAKFDNYNILYLLL